MSWVITDAGELFINNNKILFKNKESFIHVKNKLRKYDAEAFQAKTNLEKAIETRNKYAREASTLVNEKAVLYEEIGKLQNNLKIAESKIAEFTMYSKREETTENMFNVKSDVCIDNGKVELFKELDGKLFGVWMSEQFEKWYPAWWNTNGEGGSIGTPPLKLKQKPKNLVSLFSIYHRKDDSLYAVTLNYEETVRLTSPPDNSRYYKKTTIEV